MSFLITPADLPGANLAADVRLSSACSSSAMATLRGAHRVNHMFDDDEPERDKL